MKTSPRVYLGVLSVVLSTLVYLLISWLPLVGLMLTYLSDPALPLSTSAGISLTLMRDSLVMNVPPFTIIASIAAGTNFAFLIYFFRIYRPGLMMRGLPLSALGILSSLVGIGCAACGTVFLTAFSASAAGFLLMLPFDGKELGYFGIALLLFSTWSLTRAITKFSN